MPIRTERFSAVIPGRGRVQLQNIVAEAVGPSPGTIVVMAHRDNDGRGPGANDNASGTAMLIQLARAYGAPRGLPSGQLRPNHTILFLSTDGGAFGGVGAAWFAAHYQFRNDIAGVINLDSVGGSGRIRLEFGGDIPREPSGIFLQTIAARIAAQTGRLPARPSALRQLIDLGFPFSLYEQAPFLAQGIAAVTLTTAGDNPPDPVNDTKDQLRADKLAQVGRAAQDALGTLDEGLEFTQGTSTYLYLGSRLIRGWAVELVLIACLLPFLATAIDLFARCRRRRIPLAPALRAYRSRLVFWAWVVGLFELFTLLGAWPHNSARPIPPTSALAHRLAGKGTPGAYGARPARLARHTRAVDPSPRDHAGRGARRSHRLASLSRRTLVARGCDEPVRTRVPAAVAPCLALAPAGAWRATRRKARCARRWASPGPALLVGSFALRFGLGWDALWYLAELRAVGYVPFVVMPLLVVWLAGTAQLAALATRRYAPYPAASELPPRGPLRRVVRTTTLALRDRRRRGPVGVPEALEG